MPVRALISRPAELAVRTHKGSITVDGISLTVNSVRGVLPEHHPHAEVDHHRPVEGGDASELEGYHSPLRALLLGEKAAEPLRHFQAFLAENGFERQHAALAQHARSVSVRSVYRAAC